ACIIGSGGGRDVLTALAAGARQVEAVELNPYTVDAVSRVFASYSGDPYHAPGVHAFAEEGRSHFRRSKVVCDVLQISQIDTFAASAAGAYALAENSLYTVEAIQEFWSKLSDDGVLSITRWVAGPARFESMRLVLLELEALMRQGIADPRNYLVVTQGRSSASIMLFKRPPDAARLAQIAAAEQRRGFLRLWPIGPNDPIVNGVTYTLLHGPAELEKLGLDMSPSTDDRPFFFQTLSLSASLLPERDGRTSQRQESVALLPRLLLIMIAVTFGLLILPFLLRGRLPHGPQVRRGSVFFVAIGLGFMFVEIPLIQRLALYLGHPSYATTVALGSLLLGAGLGSMLSARVPEARRRTVVLATALSIAVVIIPLTGPLSAATLHWELWARVVVTAVCVSFVGLFLGMPFALGLSCFDGRERSWFWAINAAAGVLASVLALVLSIALGFQIVTLAALLCYFVAALALPARAA
ncbi:MAG TPA: hypothetical protein VHM19_22255, partial [Polyangiales bacterium]|nr:hypothetical protein [Polyangiales bacterium]